MPLFAAARANAKATGATSPGPAATPSTAVVPAPDPSSALRVIPIRGPDVPSPGPSVMVHTGTPAAVALELAALRSTSSGAAPLHTPTNAAASALGDDLPVPDMQGAEEDVFATGPVVVRRGGVVVGRPHLGVAQAQEGADGRPRRAAPATILTDTENVRWSFPSPVLPRNNYVVRVRSPGAASPSALATTRTFSTPRKAPATLDGVDSPVPTAPVPLQVAPLQFSAASLAVSLVSLFALGQALIGAFMSAYSIFDVITETNRSNSVVVVGFGGVGVMALGALGFRFLQRHQPTLCFVTSVASLFGELACGLAIFYAEYEGALTLIRIVGTAHGVLGLLALLGMLAIVKSRKVAAVNEAKLAGLRGTPAPPQLNKLAQSFRYVACGSVWV